MKKRVIGDDKFEMQRRTEDAYVVRDPLTPYEVEPESLGYPNDARPQRVNFEFDNSVPLFDERQPTRLQQHDSGIDGDLMSGSLKNYPPDYNQSIQWRPPGDVKLRPNGDEFDGNGYLTPAQTRQTPVQTTFKPRQTDSVIMGKHDYEELPVPKSPYLGINNDYETPVENQAMPPKSLPVPVKPYFNGGFQDSTPVKEQPAPPSFRSNPRSSNEPHRKRSNPLYDSVSKKPSSKSSHKCVVLSTTSCVVSVVLVLLLATAAIILAAISISMTINNKSDVPLFVNRPTPNTSNNAIPGSSPQLDWLQSQYNDLLAQVQQLNASIELIKMINTSVNAAIVLELISDNNRQQQLIDSLTQQISQLQGVTSTQNSTLTLLNAQYSGQQTQLSQLEVMEHSLQMNLTSQWLAISDLNVKVMDVSKMEGPPGPPGAGNLSQCSYQYRTKGSPVGFSDTTTQAITIDPTVSVVTGLLCSTDVGTQAFYNWESSNPNSYSCTCRGAVNATVTVRYCYIQVWTCPTTS